MHNFTRRSIFVVFNGGAKIDRLLLRPSQKDLNSVTARFVFRFLQCADSYFSLNKSSHHNGNNYRIQLKFNYALVVY
jgi:hypothetical protein